MSDWQSVDTLAVMQGRLTNYLKIGEQVPDIFSDLGAIHPQIEAIQKYIYESESIDVAKALELDRFGEYAGVERQGRDDDSYRKAILSARQRQTFSGTPDEIIQILANKLGASSVILTERKSAAVNVHLSDEVEISPSLENYIDSVAAAGVKATLTFGRGQKSFFFAGIQRVNYSLGVNGKTLGVNGSYSLGIASSKPFAFNNLAGTLVTPDLLATGDKVIGVNGKALALHKFSPKSAIANDGIRLAGCYS